MSREVTCKLLEMVEDGILNKDNLIMSCLKYMSEHDVKDMAHCEGYIEESDEEE